MTLRWSDWPQEVLAALRRGAVIPAHPLALDKDRKFDPRAVREFLEALSPSAVHEVAA